MKYVSGFFAAAVLTAASPAHAAYKLELAGGFYISGTQTTDIYATGCGVNNHCSSTTIPFNSYYTGPLEGIFNSLDGAISISGYNPIYGLGGTASLFFQYGSLITSSFYGTSFLKNIPNCPQDCVVTQSQFTGTPLRFVLTDTQTGVSSYITPVPEPSTWLMMIFGSGLASYFLRKKTKKAARPLSTI